MAAAVDSYEGWLARGQLPEHRLRPEQHTLLRAAFRFRQSQGTDYYSSRILGHFLLHCGSGLKVAAIARLLGISRPTASRQQALSAKQAIQQAHHRLDGRPYGKLLPRYAGPIAEFLFRHPEASRADLIDFVDQTFGVRVSRIALYKFLKKFGLDEATRQAAAAAPTPSATAATGRGGAAAPPLPPPRSEGPAAVPFVSQGQPVPTPAPPFSARARSTRAPSC